MSRYYSIDKEGMMAHQNQDRVCSRSRHMSGLLGPMVLALSALVMCACEDEGGRSDQAELTRSPDMSNADMNTPNQSDRGVDNADAMTSSGRDADLVDLADQAPQPADAQLMDLSVEPDQEVESC